MTYYRSAKTKADKTGRKPAKAPPARIAKPARHSERVFHGGKLGSGAKAR